MECCQQLYIACISCVFPTCTFFLFFFVILHYHYIHYVFKYGIRYISLHVPWKPAIKIYYHHYYHYCYWPVKPWPGPGPRLNIKTVLSTYGDFHVKDKTAVKRLIFNMGIAIPGKTVFLIETAPRTHFIHFILPSHMQRNKSICLPSYSGPPWSIFNATVLW